jgi:hypothetical protein
VENAGRRKNPADKTVGWGAIGRDAAWFKAGTMRNAILKSPNFAGRTMGCGVFRRCCAASQTNGELCGYLNQHDLPSLI